MAAPHYKDNDACFEKLDFLAEFITENIRQNNRNAIESNLKNCMNRRIKDCKKKRIKIDDEVSRDHYNIIKNVFDVYNILFIKNYYDWIRTKIVDQKGIIKFYTYDGNRGTTRVFYTFTLNYEGLPNPLHFTMGDLSMVHLIDLNLNEDFDSDYNLSILTSYDQFNEEMTNFITESIRKQKEIASVLEQSRLKVKAIKEAEAERIRQEAEREAERIRREAVLEAARYRARVATESLRFLQNVSGMVEHTQRRDANQRLLSRIEQYFQNNPNLLSEIEEKVYSDDNRDWYENMMQGTHGAECPDDCSCRQPAHIGRKKKRSMSNRKKKSVKKSKKRSIKKLKKKSITKRRVKK